METKEILPGLHWFNFKNCDTMCRTLVRFQEHYESSKFRNKIFSFTKFKKWYRNQTPGLGFTYYDDVAGCNFPSSALEPFRRGCFNPLREPELVFLNETKHLQGDFYIIATATSEEPEALDHEIAHGLFYLDKDYHEIITEMIEQNKEQLDDIYFQLDAWGYNRDILIDEVQAYLITDQQHLDEEGIEYPKELRDELEKVYLKYRGMYESEKEE